MDNLLSNLSDLRLMSQTCNYGTVVGGWGCTPMGKIICLASGGGQRAKDSLVMVGGKQG